MGVNSKNRFEIELELLFSPLELWFFKSDFCSVFFVFYFQCKNIKE